MKLLNLLSLIAVLVAAPFALADEDLIGPLHEGEELAYMTNKSDFLGNCALYVKRVDGQVIFQPSENRIALFSANYWPNAVEQIVLPAANGSVLRIHFAKDAQGVNQPVGYDYSYPDFQKRMIAGPPCAGLKPAERQ